MLRTISENDGSLEDAIKIIKGRHCDGIRAMADRLGLYLRRTREIDMEAFQEFIKSHKKGVIVSKQQARG